MKSLTCFVFVCSLMAAIIPTPAPAGNVTIPNTFQSGTPAVAAEVNANFSAVETEVDDNDSRIAALEAAVATLEAAMATLQSTVASQASTITTLQSTVSSQTSTITAMKSSLAAVQSSQVMALDPYLTVDAASDPRGPLVQMSGVNLQIVNGRGRTRSINGLGNLIIGYDEVNEATTFSVCSDGAYADQASCEGAGAIWSRSHKSGSHYLVTGYDNSYSQYGGIVAGVSNFATNFCSTVTGGAANLASGPNSSISGGAGNTASGGNSSITGGYGNAASGLYSSVTGGNGNTASGPRSSVSGGLGNAASGIYGSVTGGNSNTASGRNSSVTGGYGNTAGGSYSSVSGGDTRSVSGTDDWRAGTLFEDN